MAKDASQHSDSKDKDKFETATTSELKDDDPDLSYSTEPATCQTNITKVMNRVYKKYKKLAMNTRLAKRTAIPMKVKDINKDAMSNRLTKQLQKGTYKCKTTALKPPQFYGNRVKKTTNIEEKEKLAIQEGK